MFTINNCTIKVDALTFIPKDPKKAIKWIKDARKPAIDKAIEKMEKSPYFDIWLVELSND